MVCPKCEEGKVKKIILKQGQKEAYLCDICEALWFEGENIKNHTAHTLRSYSQGENIEYSVEEAEEKDQEHRSAKYPNNK
jgi:bifunctional N-acetylglucosamine-1-phosphate-uridyltransferase/glucosamine-1-phosphate-acetyltransferase GlmU-like protein